VGERGLPDLVALVDLLACDRVFGSGHRGPWYLPVDRLQLIQPSVMLVT
jgi:hypothetical protein